MAKIDFNAIKNELNSRKKEKETVSTQLGEAVVPTPTKGNSFNLRELYESFQTGRPTESSVRIKTIADIVAKKNGEPVSSNTKNAIQPVRNENSHLHNLTEVDMSPERDEQLFRDLEKKKKQTLTEQLQGFSQQPVNNPNMNYNQPQYIPQQPMQLNEEYLANNVNKMVGNYLTQNLGVIIEEANKNVILELFAHERIKTVIAENKKMIKDIVIETIRELQAKNKK